jgi:SAM-dependent methyltransferase
MKNKRCPLCDSSSNTFVPSRGEYFLSDGRYQEGSLTKNICSTCAVVFTLEVDQIGQFHYKNEYTLDNNKESVNIETGQYRSEIISKTITDLCGISLLNNPKNILDVGCGSGRLLSKISKNWNVSKLSGVEPNDDARLLLKKKGFNGYETLDEVENNHYDVAIAIAVLEHVADPDFFVSAIKQKLKKNGLIIIAVPSRSIGSHDLWVGDHMFHFSPQHLKGLAKLNGLSIFKESLGKTSGTFSYFAFVNSLDYREEDIDPKNYLFNMFKKDDDNIQKTLSSLLEERDYIKSKLSELEVFLDDANPLAVYGIGERFNFIASFYRFRKILESALLVDDSGNKPASMNCDKKVHVWNEVDKKIKEKHKWLYTFPSAMDKNISSKYMVF